MPDKYAVVITCEHGGNRVPPAYRSLFRGKRAVLNSHRGYDLGALTLARRLFSSVGQELYYSTTSRLVVDLNRASDNPRRFSEFTRGLKAEEKSRIEELYHMPYRRSVESAVSALVRRGETVLHLSVHSFTPVLRGKTRNADIGLLYDPARKREAEFCSLWLKALRAADPSLKLRRNYPYLGVSDGLVTHLRRKFPKSKYLGIELEVNQKFPTGNQKAWRGLILSVESSLKSVLKY